MKPIGPKTFVKSIWRLLRGHADMPASLSGNPTLKALMNRRSIRHFRKRAIPDDVFRAILEAGRLAPCAINLQSWSFGVFNRLSWQDTFGQPIPFRADRAVVVLGDMNRVRSALAEQIFKPLVEYTLAVMNASIAAYAMNVAAESCGISSVMLSDTGRTGFYDALFLKKKLNLPDGVFPLMTIVFGYALGSAAGMPPKLPLDQIVFEDRYRQADHDVMKSWLHQMQAGYRATRITDSLKNQLDRYNERIEDAEKGLRQIIFYKPEESARKIDR